MVVSRLARIVVVRRCWATMERIAPSTKKDSEKLNYLEVELFADDEDDEDKDKEVGTEEVVVGRERETEREREDDEMDAENDDGAETEQMGEADDCNNNDDDNDDDDDDDDNNNNNNDDDDDDDDESLEPVGIKRRYCSISKSMKPAPSTSSEAEVRRSYNEHLVKSCHSNACARRFSSLAW